MPINKKYSTYTKETVKANETDNYGVYQIANSSNDIIYIGEGKVKTRLLRHFPDAREPVVGGSKYRVEYTKSKDRARQRQNALLAEYKRNNDKKLPPFNQKSRN